MSIKSKFIWMSFVAAAMLSCCDGRVARNEEQESSMEEPLDSIVADTLVQEESELSLIVEDTRALDGFFDDFLFAYLHSPALRRERTAQSIRLERPEHPAEMLEKFDADFEFSFLSGDYFTVLYGNVGQMRLEEDDVMEEDSVVSLQRINLNDGTIRNYDFHRHDGRWQFEAIREATVQDDELCDFLNFYALFCTDSAFQSKSIADPLQVVIQDGSEEGINGIIDADQWQTFCPEVPAGIISNIRKGQYYSGHRIVMCKSGLSNGLQELFTFAKVGTEWRLTRYEN